MRRVALSALCALALAGCTGAGATKGTIPVNPTAGPGTGIMSAFDAGVIFADSCLVRGARFQTAEEGLRKHNFTLNTTLGTYYHNTKDLSVKVSSQGCSLVFASPRPVRETIAGLAMGSASIVSPAPSGISVTSRVAENGVRYFRLGIKAPVKLP